MNTWPIYTALAGGWGEAVNLNSLNQGDWVSLYIERTRFGMYSEGLRLKLNQDCTYDLFRWLF